MNFLMLIGELPRPKSTSIYLYLSELLTFIKETNSVKYIPIVYRKMLIKLMHFTVMYLVLLEL